ncbi:MAG: hypothetical protein OQK73_11700 [Gammaproteobacteria bacterium]|nr:hypothetical protein [Gammaproteobacteria bacterium]
MSRLQQVIDAGTTYSLINKTVLRFSHENNSLANSVVAIRCEFAVACTASDVFTGSCNKQGQMKLFYVTLIGNIGA